MSDCHQGPKIYSLKESNKMGQNTAPLGTAAHWARWAHMQCMSTPFLLCPQ